MDTKEIHWSRSHVDGIPQDINHIAPHVLPAQMYGVQVLRNLTVTLIMLYVVIVTEEAITYLTFVVVVPVQYVIHVPLTIFVWVAD